MTEQPMEIPQDAQQQAVQPLGMRFFVKLDDLPSAPTYMQPLSLFRFEEREDTVIMERFDKKERRWVDSPSMVAWTGIGGDESFQEINEDKANQLIDQWTPDDADVEEADAEPVPESEGEGEGEGAVPEGRLTQEEIENREIPDYDFDWREEKGQDNSAPIFDFFESVMAGEGEETESEPDEAEETVADRKRKLEEEEDEEEGVVRGLLRRIFGV